MTDWAPLIEARRAQMLDGPNVGYGHAVAHYFQVRDLYRFAVSARNDDTALVIAAAHHVALAARGLQAAAAADERAAELGGADAVLAHTLDFTPAKLAQLARWAAGDDATLAAAVERAAALGRPIKPSMLKS